MTILSDFSPAIQMAMIYFVEQPSMEALGRDYGITKQAVSKKISDIVKYLNDYSIKVEVPPVLEECDKLRKEISRLKETNQKLSRLLTSSSTNLFIQRCFIDRIVKFFPTFKLTRFEAWEKKHILDMAVKFKRLDGSLRDYCKAIGRSYDTLHLWQKAYDKYGMAGLYDKKTRPYHFSCRISKWLKEQILALFLRFPQWTPYQYCQYLKHNPAIQKSVSIPTIKKMREIHTAKSAAEKARIKKRWCFAENHQIWTVDFTCIEKTDQYKLQLLTVSDQRSRFLFESALFLETSTEKVMDHLEDLFLKYGRPFLVKVDNGPEFRLEFKEKLRDLSVYLLNSPRYYPKFDGSHERIHRSLKTYISNFFVHKNLTRLVKEIDSFTDERNYHMTFEYLESKTPAQIYYTDEDFIPKNTEVVRPYFKEGELRMKFINRLGGPARLALPMMPE